MSHMVASHILLHFFALILFPIVLHYAVEQYCSQISALHFSLMTASVGLCPLSFSTSQWLLTLIHLVWVPLAWVSAFMPRTGSIINNYYRFSHSSLPCCSKCLEMTDASCQLSHTFISSFDFVTLCLAFNLLVNELVDELVSLCGL